MAGWAIRAIRWQWAICVLPQQDPLGHYWSARSDDGLDMLSPMRIESRFSKEGSEALKSRNEILLLGLLAAGIAWAGGPGAAPAGGEETWMAGPGQTLMAATTTSAPDAARPSVE